MIVKRSTTGSAGVSGVSAVPAEAGKRAFEAEDVSETLAAVLRGEPDWSGLPATVPPPLIRLERRCLEKDPKRRFRDIAEVRIEIEDTPITTPACSGSQAAVRCGI